MKTNIYILFIFIFTVHFSTAQVMLDVEGDGQINNSLLIFDDGSGAAVHAGTLSGSFLGINNTNNNLTLANSTVVANSFADINISSTDRIYFLTNGSRHMTLSPTGRLGIGTENPSRSLDVRDDIYIGGGSADFNSTSEHLRIGAQSDSWYLGALNEASQAASDFIIGLNSSGSGMFHIENGGDVGIGTDEPIARLHLQDAGHQMVLENDDDPTNTWYVGASAPTWLTGANHLIFDDDGNTSLPILCLHGTEEAVSIGTSYASPGYKLAVNGAIIAEEVRVELRNDWPDYVFDKSYELAPLSEVEKAINATGHLPGIPSAKEIEKDGLLIGDMQTRMMEKIEELTLYIIQLDKENKELRQLITEDKWVGMLIR